MDYEKDVFNVSSPSKETIEEKVKETKKSIGELIPIPSQIKRGIRPSGWERAKIRPFGQELLPTLRQPERAKGLMLAANRESRPTASSVGTGSTTLCPNSVERERVLKEPMSEPSSEHERVEMSQALRDVTA
ncbi:hypothetical protein F2Q68_00025403 [Brassica cretica]|uniref:Uncharacterized protein n=1 Tax=Brassica cretica TaxID=69181 RepID=A0A8S9IFD7_BRACR|nr:hypothetical protein F2Q68_00025403 [Brassica cretica]